MYWALTSWTCAYNFPDTVLCCWIHSWKGVYTCVNVEVHPQEEVTVCSVHGKQSYRILASTACMARNATENYSFGCTGSWGCMLRWQYGLVGKAHLWVRRFMLHFSLSPLFIVTLWEATSQDYLLILVSIQKAIAALPILEFFVMCLNDNLCFTRCLCFWK